jgi:hypothetical protein
MRQFRLEKFVWLAPAGEPGIEKAQPYSLAKV